MPLADNGAFDLVAAVTPAKLGELLASAVTNLTGQPWDWQPEKLIPIPFDSPELPISWDLRFAPGPVGVEQTGTAIALSWTPAVSSTWSWNEIDLPTWPWQDLPPLPAGSAPFAGMAITLRGSVVAGTAVTLTDIDAEVTVDATSVRQMPPITYFLTWLDLLWPDGLTPDAGTFLDVEEVLASFTAAISAKLTAMANAALPDSVRLLTVPVGSVALRVLARDLLILWERQAGNGVPGLIARSPIRHRPDGSERDLVAIDVANAFLLGSIRAELANHIGWLGTDGVFAQSHPCCWTGQHVVLTKFEVSVAITALLVSVDELNGVSVTVTLAGTHSSGGFGVTGQASTYWRCEARDGGHKLAVLGNPLTVHDVDLWVAWWVYVLMGVGGGPLGILITGLHDAIDGGEFVGELTRLLAPVLPTEVVRELPWVAVVPAPVVHPQPDAIWQIAPMPVPTLVSRNCDVFLAVEAPGG